MVMPDLYSLVSQRHLKRLLVLDHMARQLPDFNAAVVTVVVALKDILTPFSMSSFCLCDSWMHAVLDSGVHAASAEDAADSQLPQPLQRRRQPFHWMGIHYNPRWW